MKCEAIGCENEAEPGYPYCGQVCALKNLNWPGTEYEDLTPEEMFGRCDGKTEVAAAGFGKRMVTNWLIFKNATIRIPKPKPKPKRADGLWRVRVWYNTVYRIDCVVRIVDGRICGACCASNYSGLDYDLIEKDIVNNRADSVEFIYGYPMPSGFVLPVDADKEVHQEPVAAAMQAERAARKDELTAEERLLILENAVLRLEINARLKEMK